MISLIKRVIANRRLARIRAAQAIAYAAYQGAYERGDTRRMHETWPALKAAMTAKLRAEVMAR